MPSRRSLPGWWGEARRRCGRALFIFVVRERQHQFTTGLRSSPAMGGLLLGRAHVAAVHLGGAQMGLVAQVRLRKGAGLVVVMRRPTKSWCLAIFRVVSLSAEARNWGMLTGMLPWPS